MTERSAAATDVDEPLETREVRVDDPNLSAQTNRRLTEQLQEVVGEHAVDVPKSRPRPSRGEENEEAPRAPFGTNNWLMAMIGVFASLVIAGIIVTSVTGSWWFIAVAIVLDIIGIVVIATVVIRMTAITERPDPTLVAAMEQEGVRNPEEHFTEIVDEFRQGDAAGGEDRDTAVQDDPARAAAEQRSAVTPTSGHSRAVGP